MLLKQSLSSQPRCSYNFDMVWNSLKDSSPLDSLNILYPSLSIFSFGSQLQSQTELNFLLEHTMPRIPFLFWLPGELLLILQSSIPIHLLSVFFLISTPSPRIHSFPVLCSHTWCYYSTHHVELLLRTGLASPRLSSLQAHGSP